MINLSAKRRKKTKEPEKEEAEMVEETATKPEYMEKVDFGEQFKTEKAEVTTTKEKEPTPTDIVKVEVLIGTLQWEEGTFSKGDIFETTRERAERFSNTSVKILG